MIAGAKGLLRPDRKERYAMMLHPDLAALYVSGSVLVSAFIVYGLHALGSAIGRAAREARLRREAHASH